MIWYLSSPSMAHNFSVLRRLHGYATPSSVQAWLTLSLNLTFPPVPLPQSVHEHSAVGTAHAAGECHVGHCAHDGTKLYFFLLLVFHSWILTHLRATARIFRAT